MLPPGHPYTAMPEQGLCFKNEADPVNLDAFYRLRGIPFMDNSTPFKWRHARS